ncbi:sugar transferase [[Ruminococcus] gnavus]|uniref:sugar transferase n=1 Tax=Mediterraneibacter gnavus TaxID=33038 RepID=UPI00210A8A62|nr:sugar transferase [Mediterraneibacter gnavus]MCQ4701338.1 sugar transferase [Mediterraneibacter gnavus]
MSIDKKKIGKILKVTAIGTGVTFLGLNMIAKKKKGDSVFEKEKDQKNPFAGKKVVFVEDESDEENADGVRGHLEAVGETKKSKGIYDRYIKRAIDVVLSFGGLVVLSPIYAGIAIAIKIDDPGPVFFTQKRVGQNKEFFKIHKFRSMKMSTPHDVPTHMLGDPEQYITRVGKFLRKHSLDELPQIWDIFIGNMSVIGPRPALWNQDVLIAEREKYNANDVKPGLTGWAQINGRDELEIPVKAKLDGEYVEKESLLFDIKCFLGTIGKVAKDDSVVEGGTGEMSKQEVLEETKENEKKKILVICQYYKPEPFRISDICEELVCRGHEVHVVTGYPNYPEGILYEGYGKGKHIDEVINGVKVHRCYTVPRQTGIAKRLLNYYSYAISSTKYVLSKKCVASDGKAFDVVYCNQLSPVMMAHAAIAYKKKYKVPVVMYCLDLWPESLIAGNILRNSVVYKYFDKVSKRIYKNMDKILVTSEMFQEYFESKFAIKNTYYLPQYAEALFNPEICYKKPNEFIDLMFAGNIGTAQSVETIIRTAAKCKDMKQVRWHIVGNGSDFDRCQNLAEELKLGNLIFYGRKNIDEMPQYYSMADAMLVTMQKDEVLSLTLPGKVQSYMAAGKAIIGAIDGETRKVVENAKCGFVSNAEDVDDLANQVKRFVSLKSEEREKLGVNAREYYNKYFSKETFMDYLERAIKDSIK